MLSFPSKHVSRPTSFNSESAGAEIANFNDGEPSNRATRGDNQGARSRRRLANGHVPKNFIIERSGTDYDERRPSTKPSDEADIIRRGPSRIRMAVKIEGHEVVIDLDCRVAHIKCKRRNIDDLQQRAWVRNTEIRYVVGIGNRSAKWAARLPVKGTGEVSARVVISGPGCGIRLNYAAAEHRYRAALDEPLADTRRIHSSLHRSLSNSDPHPVPPPNSCKLTIATAASRACPSG